MESESLTHNCLFVPTVSGKVIRIRNPFILSLLVVCKMFIFRIDAVISSPLTADNCPGLAGRPKLIFVQACQGKVTLLLFFGGGGGYLPYCSSHTVAESGFYCRFRLRDFEIPPAPTLSTSRKSFIEVNIRKSSAPAPARMAWHQVTPAPHHYS